MTCRQTRALRTLFLSLGLASSIGMAHAADRTTLSAGMTYLSGDYGQASTTEILYVPFTLKHRTGPWTLKLTVPYLRISGQGGVLPDLGATGTTGTGSGLGDVIAGATYRAHYDTDSGLLVNVTGKVKLPTADEDKGLGTGEADYYAEVSVFKVGKTWTPFGTLGYKVIGDTATTNYNNVAYVALGTSYKVDDATSVGARAYFRQKTRDSNDPRQELSLFSSRKLSKNWKLSGHLIKGFTDASADWGVGGNIGYTF